MTDQLPPIVIDHFNLLTINAQDALLSFFSFLVTPFYSEDRFLLQPVFPKVLRAIEFSHYVPG